MLLIKPYLGCNLKCEYCYEGSYRSIHKPNMSYNLNAIMRRMDEYKNLSMSLHGGEPLCLPHEDIEKLLAKSFELTGRSGIQTNGTLIDEAYIAMFKKYKTGVGISFDGSGELTSFRMGIEQAKKVEDIIYKLADNKVSVSIITVLSKSNASTDTQLSKLKEFLLRMKELGISGRINPCTNAPECELPLDRLAEVYLSLAEFCIQNGLHHSPFRDIVNGLQDKGRVCVFMGCDPFSTPSCTVVLGDGSITNCMRTNQAGILLRSPVHYPTRDQILQEIPYESGGCMDCKFFSACHGGCPSSSIDNDWRNRTYLCPVWKELFFYFSNILNFCGVQQEKTKRPAEAIPIPGRPGWYHTDSPHGDSC